ncbi:MAG: hypothetical protein HYZ71_14550 [Deltaproteobacteria bacterium]|nr:hypothetical protein [Deltaproteobacteria bacterium]
MKNLTVLALAMVMLLSCGKDPDQPLREGLAVLYGAASSYKDQWLSLENDFGPRLAKLKTSFAAFKAGLSEEDAKVLDGEIELMETGISRIQAHTAFVVSLQGWGYSLARVEKVLRARAKRAEVIPEGKALYREVKTVLLEQYAHNATLESGCWDVAIASNHIEKALGKNQTRLVASFQGTVQAASALWFLHREFMDAETPLRDASWHAERALGLADH